MREIHSELQSFQSLYHKKKALVEALDLVLLGKNKMEEDLDATIKNKEEALSTKRKRVMKDNSVILGGRVKRVKFSKQLESTMGEVKDLSERVDDTEQELSSLDEALNALTGEIGDLQEKVQDLLEDY
jgi:predicted  nucleic acid-binding Zn-ribbon protein